MRTLSVLAFLDGVVQSAVNDLLFGNHSIAHVGHQGEADTHKAVHNHAGLIIGIVGKEVTDKHGNITIRDKNVCTVEGDGRIKEFVGTYSEYREYIKEKESAERSEVRSTTPKPQQQRSHDNSKRKLSYKEQRELEQIEADLKSLNDERTKLEAEISSGTLVYERLTELSTRIEEIITTIDEKEMRWLELNE